MPSTPSTPCVGASRKVSGPVAASARPATHANEARRARTPTGAKCLPWPDTTGHRSSRGEGSDEFEEDHLRGVRPARAELHDARVAAGALRVARRDLLEELVHEK